MRKGINPTLIKDIQIIGDKIRQIRKERTDLNYKDFAEKLQNDGVKISKNTLQRIETGEDYYLSSLLTLLKYFEIKPSDFFREAGL